MKQSTSTVTQCESSSRIYFSGKPCAICHEDFCHCHGGCFCPCSLVDWFISFCVSRITQKVLKLFWLNLVDRAWPREEPIKFWCKFRSHDRLALCAIWTTATANCNAFCLNFPKYCQMQRKNFLTEVSDQFKKKITNPILACSVLAEVWAPINSHLALLSMSSHSNALEYNIRLSCLLLMTTHILNVFLPFLYTIRK